MSQRQSPDLQQRTTLISKYGSIDSVLARYNPDCQLAICGDPDDCHFGDYPTLSQLRIGYGKKTPVMWLLPQLYNLSEYCGCRDKLQGKPLEECAGIIASEYHWLKVSELMLFFHRFKSGCYGRFYGSVDPLIITTALRDFCKERAEAWVKHEQQLREEREKEKACKVVSWEEHCMKTYGKLKPHPLSRLNDTTK